MAVRGRWRDGATILVEQDDSGALRATGMTLTLRLGNLLDDEAFEAMTSCNVATWRQGTMVHAGLPATMRITEEYASPRRAGSLAGLHRCLQTIQNAQRMLPKVQRCWTQPLVFCLPPKRQTHFGVFVLPICRLEITKMHQTTARSSQK